MNHKMVSVLARSMVPLIAEPVERLRSTHAGMLSVLDNRLTGLSSENALLRDQNSVLVLRITELEERQQELVEKVSAASETIERMSEIIDRVSALEQREAVPGPQGPQGEPGRDGVDGQPGERGEPGPQGERGEKGERGEPGQPGERGEKGERGEPGERGERGERGMDGRDAVQPTQEQLREILFATKDGEFSSLRSVVAEYFEAYPPPAGKDGAPGRDGEHGRDGLPGLPGRDGKDGAPGRDGADGLGFEDLTLEHDGERTMTFIFKRGDHERRFDVTLPVPIERGLWRDGTEYQRGDAVTWGGSGWIAQRNTTAKPETSPDWRLFVKRGRDGKEGKQGKQGERGPAGKDGATWQSR